MPRDVLLIHGSGFTSEIWSPFVDAMSDVDIELHAPNLRHHDPTPDQRDLVAGTGLAGYVEDLVGLARSFPTNPLIIGHSMGATIAQRVAEQVQHSGLICVAPSPSPGMSSPPPAARYFGRHLLHLRPWARGIPPMPWDVFRQLVANEQDLDTARWLFELQVFGSGRAFCESAVPFLDRRKAAAVDYGLLRSPVLVIGGSRDRTSSVANFRQLAARMPVGESLIIDGADHEIPVGRYLPHLVDAVNKVIVAL